MKEKPILFSAPMVRAILEGRKTQTRRVIKPQPQRFFEVNEEPLYLYDVEWNLGSIYPKYQPGDILWVRETWGILNLDYHPINVGNPNYPVIYVYKADHITGNDGPERIKWRPSIHMPRSVARLFLEVENVRAERLQEITEEDAKAEGCYCIYEAAIPFQRLAGQSFESVWDALYSNSGEQWESNPWVWVVDFRRVQHGTTTS